MKQYLSRLSLVKSDKLIGLAIVLLVAVAGSYLLFQSHAATPATASEAESGTINSPAIMISDATASGGQAIKFGIPSTGPQSCPAYPAFPDATCTGVPAGVTLTSFSGCANGYVTITTANTVIDSKTVNCDLVIRATGIVIKNSYINGNINIDEDLPGSANITDSEITGGAGTKNLTVLRADIHGGVGPNFYCYTNCDIRDSWLHTPRFPTPGAGEGCDTVQLCGEAHLGAFLANDDGPTGSTTSVTLIHNRIHCDTPTSIYDGGCSGDVNLFGDFGKISNVMMDKNYLGGSSGISYCFYGGDSDAKGWPRADHVVVTNNIWQKAPTGHCGGYGPVTGFGTDPTLNPGNTWTNNKFDDGTIINPER